MSSVSRFRPATRMSLACLVVTALAAAALTALVPSPSVASPATAPKPAAMTPVAGSAAATRRIPVTTTRVAQTPDTWTGSHAVDLTKTAVGGWQASGLAGVSLSRQSAASASKVVVAALSPAERKALGITGAAVRITQSNGPVGQAGLKVHLDRSALAGVFGADYLGRARWQEVTGSDTTPVTADRLRPVITQSDNATGAVILSPATTGGASTLLVASGATDSTRGTGDFAATSLSPSSSWQVSAQTGSFSWSYPLRVPPGGAGPQPQLSLSYDSGSVDGETGSTNNQPSAIGDGWSLAGSGFIERSYSNCSDDGQSGSADKCWGAGYLSVAFGGHSGKLVRIGSTNVYRLQDDDGSRITHETGAGNGDSGDSVDGVGEYWIITTPDGTRYYFGRGHLPGGSEATNAAWTEPVFGNDVGESCHGATFAASSCTQAYRWNLDYVLNAHGASEAFYYAAETNRYAAAGGAPVSYVRGGQLARIDYGTSSTGDPDAASAARVVFGLGDRCVTSSCSTHNATNWPDVPWDLQCDTGTCAGQNAPSFFSTKRVTTITTQIWSGASYANVDAWTLAHSFPDPGDSESAALWLDTVHHVGYGNGGTSLTTPDTRFNKYAYQNRVTVIDGLALQWKFRISSINTDTGGTVVLSYSAAECDSSRPAPESNTKRCFPQWWNPGIQSPQLDWFNKYVVTMVSNQPGGSDATDDSYYDYVGTPAWRYDSSPITPAVNRTWSEFAGYSSVRIRHGDASTAATQESTTYTYYQGMDGDRLNTVGGSKSVTVTDSTGTAVTDSRWLAGRVRESRTNNGAASGAARISNTITTPWASTATATEGSNTARLTGDAEVLTKTALAAGGDRTTRVQNTFDSYGRVVSVSDLGDTATSADDRCTTTSYADNATAWLLDYPSEVATVGVACGTSASYPANAVSDTRTYYDGNPGLSDPPTTGDATTVSAVSGYTGSTAASATWQVQSTSSYDALGRVLTTTDPRISPARTVTMTYTPTGAGLPTAVSVQNPLSWTTSTSYDPRWGVVTAVTDQNAHVSEAAYDALGRRTQVWLPDRPRASNPVPNMGYSYTVPVDSNNLATGHMYLATANLTPSGGTLTDYQIYDGLGRPRQTQAAAEGGGRVLTDTVYDGTGRVSATNSPYYATGTAGGTMFLPATVVPGIEQTSYDGASRPTAHVSYVNGTEVWRTSYAYGGNYTDLTPPAGGTATRTYTDARGNASELRQYHAATVTGVYDHTTYSYNSRGDMTSMSDGTNAAGDTGATTDIGNTWTWTFDVLGRQTAASDPDKGSTTSTYDAAGRLATTTDAAGTRTLAYVYDALDRKVEQRSGSSTGTLLAAWTYDTLAKGQLTNATSYANGLSYLSKVNSYDAMDRVTSHSVVIPADPSNTARNAVAGTYTMTAAYTAAGQVQSEGRSAVGSIPIEAISRGYDSFGNPTTLASSSTSYVTSTSFTSLDELSQYSVVQGTKNLTRTFSYADGTRRLTRDLTTTSATGNATAADHHYTYNAAGLVTQDQNIATAAGTDTQCYSYDYVQQLTEAWTPTSGNCATARANASLAGPAPYWQSYSYYANGNRKAITRHATTGTGTNTVDTYSYPATGSARPHAVTTVARTGASTATSSYGYDADGNTITRPGQSLTFDINGHLATVTAGTSTQSDVYDADGNRLLQTDPAGVTLYLGDTEAHVNTGTTTVTAVRTYSLADTIVAERTSSTAASWLITDDHGTAEIAMSISAGTITRRHSDPFGNPRDPAAVTWPDNHGYLNQPKDSLTTTTHLGAREYDPTLGRFLTVDPVLDSAQPQTINGYSYSANNPTNTSDPSGLMQACDGPCHGGDSVGGSSRTGITPPSAGLQSCVGCTPGAGRADDGTGSHAAPQAAAGGNFTAAHDAALAVAATMLRAMVGGNGVVEPNYYISSGSKKKNGNYGFADLVWIDAEDVRHVWEVKAFRRVAQGPIEAAWYVSVIEANGDKAVLGGPIDGLPAQSAMGQAVYNFGIGGIGYGNGTMTPVQLPKTVPVKVPKEVPVLAGSHVGVQFNPGQVAGVAGIAGLAGVMAMAAGGRGGGALFKYKMS